MPYNGPSATASDGTRSPGPRTWTVWTGTVRLRYRLAPARTVPNGTLYISRQAVRYLTVLNYI